MTRNRTTAGRLSRSDEERSVVERHWQGFRDSVLLGANRSLVAAGIAVVFASFFTVIISLPIVPLADLQALFYAYSALTTGNLTLITVIVSLNQLLLSRELQTPDEVRDQIESVLDYRTNIEDATDRVAPVKPLGFLRLLVEATRQEAQRLGGLAKDDVVQSGHDEIEDVVTDLTAEMDRIDELLLESDAGTFSVLSLMLVSNYAEHINDLRTVHKTYGDDFADEVHDSIEKLVERLQEIDIARQYFKSIYMQQELASLSRVLLYAGLPAVAIGMVSILVLTVPASNPARVPYLPVVLPISLTVGLLPLSILASFFLRTATVTRLTAATLPFTTPEQEQ